MKAGRFPETAIVADPSRYASRVARDLLLGAGVRRVVEVADGAEALSALSERRPELLVLDWGLAVIGAREVITMARDGQGADEPAIPVIVTMSSPVRSEVQSALDLAVGAVLAVPYCPRDFRDRLRRLVGSLVH